MLALFFASVVLAVGNITQTYNPASYQLRGVSIGGWLVLEPYVTPSLFKAISGDTPVDEYHYCKTLGQDEAAERLKEHWDTFYNESDFAEIKQRGLNMVRIPIGYWAYKTLPDDPYVAGASEYLEKAIGWAKNQDLKVWIDLHGVPGTQNGFDNSGLRSIGYPGWFNSTTNVELTLEVLKTMYTRYGTGDFARTYADTILGIQIVNEPLGPVLGMDKVNNFYVSAYQLGRQTMELNTTIVFHDAFQPIGYYNDFMDERKMSNSSKYTGLNITSNRNTSVENYNIMIDHHHYEVFASNIGANISEHIANINNYAQSIEDELKHHPAVVGEFSAALTDCTPWLNGVGLGTRWEGTEPYTDFNRSGSCNNINNIKKWTKEHKKNTRKFIEVQLDQYSRYSNGWIFWCWKTEDTIEWDFKRLVEYDLMPQPLDDFKYIKNGTDTEKTSGGVKQKTSWGLLVGMFIVLAAQ